jgi:hypothetical protein
MAVCIYYYQYNLYVYELCIFIRYLVSITQVLKDTSFGLDNWCESVNLSTFSCGMQEQETWYLCVRTCTRASEHVHSYLCGSTYAAGPVQQYLFGITCTAARPVSACSAGAWLPAPFTEVTHNSCTNPVDGTWVPQHSSLTMHFTPYHIYHYSNYQNINHIAYRDKCQRCVLCACVAPAKNNFICVSNA